MADLTTIEAIKNFNRVKDPSKAINVLMVGGRRVGKTAVLSSMCHELDHNQVLANKVFFKFNENDRRFAEYRTEHLKLFEDQTESCYHASDDPDFEAKNVSGRVSFVGQRDFPMELNFIDVPGEWFEISDEQARKHFEEEMNKCHVLIVTIDTPALMENIDVNTGYGKYHQPFNKVDQIETIVANALQGDDLIKFVLFVPMKCEKYKISGQMDKVREAVHKGYAKLFQTLASHKETCTVAIVPCITMGVEGMAFENWVPRTREDFGTPMIVENQNGCLAFSERWWAQYKYIYNNEGYTKYSPEYCDQLLIYILLFFVMVGKQKNEIKDSSTKKSKSIFGRLWSWIERIFGKIIVPPVPETKTLIRAEETLRNAINKNTDEGFEVVYDPFKCF